MPVDPSIALSAQANAPNVQQMYTLANMAQQYQQNQQQVDAQNKLKELYQDPENKDAQGNLNQNALTKLMQVDPRVGMQVQQNQLQTRQQQMRVDMLTSDRFQKQMDLSHGAYTNARVAYEDALKSGMSQDQAAQIGQKALSERVDELKGSGMFSDAEQQKFSTKFDPNNFDRLDKTYLQYKTFLANQEANKTKLDLAVHREQRETDQGNTRLNIEGRRENREENQGAQRLNIEASKISPEDAAMTTFRRENPDASPEKLRDFAATLRKQPADNKWTVMSDPNHQDPQGNPVEYRYNSSTGQSTTLDGKPLGFTPTAAIKPNPANAGMMTGRESQMVGRVMTAAQDTMKDLGNIMELPVSSSTGWFGGRKQGPSLFDAGKEVLTNSVTSQEVQDFNVHTVGLGRAMAAIEGMGLAPNQHFQDQFDRLMLKEGDSQLTKMRKLASIRQQAESGIDTILASPRVGKDQKKLLEEARANIAKDVPFTPHDVTELEKSKDPKKTLRDFADSKGLGGGEKKEAEPSGGMPHPTTPDEYKSLPSGTIYTAPDGKKYRKS